MQRSIPGSLVNHRPNADPDGDGPYFNLLIAIIERARKDARQTKRKNGDQSLATDEQREEAARFLAWCARELADLN